MHSLIRGGVLLCVLAVAGCGVRAPVPDSNPDSATASNEAPARGFLAVLRAGRADSDAPARPASPPLAKAALVGGKVVVAGPEGYCVDPVSLQRGPGRGFAVIASCRVLSDGKVGASVAPVIITVTLGPRASEGDLPAPETLATVAGAPLISGARSDGLALAHLGSGGDATLPKGDARYWRGAFVQGGRLVGLALYAPKGDRLAGPRGGSLLQDVRNRIRSESDSTASSGQNAPSAPETVEDTGQNTGQKRGGGLLSRLFDR